MRTGQFLLFANEKQLALWFRLQNELDPCLKYDSVRKIWIYLHRHKRPEDFSEAPQRQSAPRKRLQKRAKVRRYV